MGAMNVNLGEHFEKMVEDLIAGGRFQNQSEVLRAGLRLLEDREYASEQALETELLRRLDSPSTPWTKKDLGKIRKLGHAKIKNPGLKTAA